MSAVHNFRQSDRKLQVFMLDLWATVPYYTAYLSRALLAHGTSVRIGSITYYLDRSCFKARALVLSPGLLDLVGRLTLPRWMRRGLKLAEGCLNLLALASRFLARPPDVLHVQFLPLLCSRLPLDAWFVRFCQARGIPTVLTVHDLLPHDTGETHHDRYRRLYESMDELICHSAHVKESLVQTFSIASEKITVIPHGPFFFDTPVADSGSTLAALEVPADATMVLWQGIVLPYKGVDLLLAAWQRAEAASDTLHLVVMGTGQPALLSGLMEKARELGLKRVHFHPRFCSPEELVAAYRAASMVIYPYRAITTSGALATGLSLGKAIIASRLPVFEELLRSGENALLVDPTNTEEMAEAIVHLTQNADLRASLERKVQAMQFSQRMWSEIAERTIGVYQRVEEGGTLSQNTTLKETVET